jgi:two-component system, OmpR family, sensor kinase
MSNAWTRLGLRGRLALSIGAIVLAAFAVLFVAVHHEISGERPAIERGTTASAQPGENAQAEVDRAFLLFGGFALLAALLAGYLLAAHTAAPLRRMAATTAIVDGGDLKPRIGAEPTAAVEVRTLAEGFDRMLDRLEAAFSRQRRFVADASHELRTPLTAVRGQLEVLARQSWPDAGEVRRVEGLVMREMERIELLVDDLLALASVEEGGDPQRRQLALEPFLRELVRESDSAASIGAVAAGEIGADSEQLRRALINLLSNARRHAGPSGKVELSATAEGGRLTIRVDDDGPGIPPQERERVFERFHRADGARDRGSGGAGLGLAIARSIAESHGGRIWAQPSPLGGARISLEMPGFQPQLGSA